MTHTYAGIDTHGGFHHLAIVDADGRPVHDEQFPTTVTGYTDLEATLARQRPTIIGIEGTSSYGAAITHILTAAGHHIVEVNRPDRTQRRAQGKSDRTDAINAAHAARTGRATTPPKLESANLATLRVTMMTRTSATKGRTQAINEIRALITTAPADLADELKPLTLKVLIATCTQLRPDQTKNWADAAVKTGLRTLAERWTYLDHEITVADHTLTSVLTTMAPELLALDSVGPHTAAQLLISAGANPDRLRSEACFARHAGVAPIPASSGKTQRHRLHRGGDRTANHALWRIAFNRTTRHPATIAYTQRRSTELSRNEILRCLKRHIVREIHPILVTIINREHHLNQTTHTA